MTERLETVVAKKDRLPNPTNIVVVKEFHAFRKANGTSDRHQMNSIKAVTAFGHHLGRKTTFLWSERRTKCWLFPEQDETVCSSLPF
jgi:hypothetical protein